MPNREFVNLSGLLRELQQRFPSNPPRLEFVCLRDFDCCSDVSRHRALDSLREVLDTSGLRLQVDLAPVSNTQECATLILRIANAICRHLEQSTLAALHRALFYTVSVFHFHISPASASVAQARLRSVPYDDFLRRYEPHQILGFDLSNRQARGVPGRSPSESDA